MCWQPTEWSFVRGNIQIAVVVGRVCRVVVDELFIQRSGKTIVKSEWSLIKGVVHEGFCCSSIFRHNSLTTPAEGFLRTLVQ